LAFRTLCIEAEPIVPTERQEELVSLLLESAAKDDDVSEFLVNTFLPLLHPNELVVLERPGSHNNLFFREAVFVFVRNHPLPIHRHLVEVLAKDCCGQVTRPAAEALKTLRRNDSDRAR
jgi:hypothetical protein